MEIKGSYQQICPWCGQVTNIIWVHGHGQCSVCGMITDERCRGEQYGSNDSQDPDSIKQDNK